MKLILSIQLKEISAAAINDLTNFGFTLVFKYDCIELWRNV